MSDLCWVCQKNASAIMRAANRPDTEKSDVRTQLLLVCNVIALTITQAVKAAEAHLFKATLERSYCKAQTEDCTQALRAKYTSDEKFDPPPPNSAIAPMSNGSLRVHYSFDMAQQVSQQVAYNVA